MIEYVRDGNFIQKIINLHTALVFICIFNMLFIIATILILPTSLVISHFKGQYRFISRKIGLDIIQSFTSTKNNSHSSKLLLEELLNSISVPLLLIAPYTAQVTFANKAVTKLAGDKLLKAIAAKEYDAADYFTDSMGNPISQEQMPGVRVARGERLEGLELEWHSCGAVYSLVIFADTLPAMDNYPTTCVMILQDITSLKQRETALSSIQQQTEKLQELNRLKDEFLAVLTHELRSPLNAILGWSQLLRTRKLNPHQIDQAVESIERNARSQVQLVEDLLDISSIIQGKLQFSPIVCNLISIIKSAIESVHLAARAKNIQIKFAPAQEKLENIEFLLSGNPERLQQVFWNLLANAIKFTPPGGKVEIHLTKTFTQGQHNRKDDAALYGTNYVLIDVIDTGIGIHPDFLPYVFDRFRQADSSNTRAYGGLGVGLALVRHLVEMHGGTVSVNSLGENRGTTFTVKLPLLCASGDNLGKNVNQCSQLTAEPPNIFLSGVKVLVVVADTECSAFITAILEQYHSEVLVAASVSEVWPIIHQSHPDALIGDLYLPDEDGYSLMRQLRSRSPEQGGKIPAAALTSYGRAQERFLALQAGYQLHLPKPIEPAEMVTVVATLAGRILHN
jgi:signal transduction histidine kinase/ActR/RegA family two-component response regulator